MPKPVQAVRKSMIPTMKWAEGREVFGRFVELIAKETINTDSDKLVFRIGPNKDVSVWQTGVLETFMPNIRQGGFYHIKCLGKTIETSRAMAWGFEVTEYDPKDAADRAVIEGFGKECDKILALCEPLPGQEATY